jgi:hypothetical protein
VRWWRRAEEMNVDVVNVIPNALSGETNQDSEPSISVNPDSPNEIVVTAFTPNPSGGANAPIFVSTNGGGTWVLNANVPSQAGAAVGTGDIKTAFAGRGGRLYGGILRIPGSLRLNVLRAQSAIGAGTMTILEDRNRVDQPFTEAATVAAGPDLGDDRFYVGLNDFAAAGGQTASIDVCLDASIANPVVNTVRIESRGTGTAGQDGPQVRPAIHPDGTVYAVFSGWRAFSATSQVTTDIVVVRDDNWATGANPFADLVDAADGQAGNRVATGLNFTWNGQLGQERLGGDIAIAVDPRNSDTVYVAYCNVQGGAYTIHVRRSTDRGVTWSADLRTIPNAKNPALAVNSAGKVGFAFQQVVTVGTTQRWQTHFQSTTNAFTTAEDRVLADVPATAPTRTFLPYLGDYIHMVAVGTTFYGVFSANNTPDMANFPSGVTFQRNADFTTNTLLALDGSTPVAISIDPFFFKASEPFDPFTGLTRFTGFTRFTRFTPFTPFTPFTKFTRFTPFTPFTEFTQFTRFTPFTRFTRFTRFTAFTPFTPFTRWGPGPDWRWPIRELAPLDLTRGADDFIRFQGRVFAPEELWLGSLEMFGELVEPLGTLGITHLHQLAVASSAELTSGVGLDPEEAYQLVEAARAMLRRLAR